MSQQEKTWALVVVAADGRQTTLMERYASETEAEEVLKVIAPIRARGGATVRVVNRVVKEAPRPALDTPTTTPSKSLVDLEETIASLADMSIYSRLKFFIRQTEKASRVLARAQKSDGYLDAEMNEEIKKAETAREFFAEALQKHLDMSLEDAVNGNITAPSYTVTILYDALHRITHVKDEAEKLPLLRAKKAGERQKTIEAAMQKIAAINQKITQVSEAITKAQEYTNAIADAGLTTLQIGSYMREVNNTIPAYLVARTNVAYSELARVLTNSEGWHAALANRLEVEQQKSFRQADDVDRSRDQLMNTLRAILRNTMKPWRMPRALSRGHSKSISDVQKGKDNLLALSHAQDIHEAEREWDYVSQVMYEGDLKFPGQCEICHAQGVKLLYLIENQVNKNIAWVGRECVRRYMRFGGLETPEDADRRLENKEGLRQALEVAVNVTAVLFTEKKIDGDRFDMLRRAICVLTGTEPERIADLKDGHSLPEALSRVVGESWDKFSEGHTEDASLILAALFSPASVLRRRTMRDRKYEGQTIGARKRRIWTSLARGEHTRAVNQKNDG